MFVRRRGVQILLLQDDGRRTPPDSPQGGFAPSGISVARALPPQLDVRTVKNLKMSPKGRTDLKI